MKILTLICLFISTAILAQDTNRWGLASTEDNGARLYVDNTRRDTAKGNKLVWIKRIAADRWSVLQLLECDCEQKMYRANQIDTFDANGNIIPNKDSVPVNWRTPVPDSVIEDIVEKVCTGKLYPPEKLVAQIIQPVQQINPLAKLSGSEIIAAAKTICIVQAEGGNPVVKAKISERVRIWGKLTIVAEPNNADLILQVTQTGEYSMKDHFGSYSSAVGVLRAQGSAVELWTTSKGSYWSWSGLSIDKVALQIADSFVKYFDATVKKVKK